MRPTQPRLHRLLRVVLACWSLLVVFEPPPASSVASELFARSGWMAPGALSSGGARPDMPPSAESVRAESVRAESIDAPSARVDGTPRGVLERTALSLGAGSAPGVDETAPARRDGRYLYLEYQSLLC